MRTSVDYLIVFELMGAVLSVPLIPVQMGLSALSSCVGAGVSTAVCSGLGTTFSSGIVTRIFYAMIFMINSIISWISLSSWAIGKLDLLKYACGGDNCTGFTAVHRINSGLGLLHLSLAGILLALPAAAKPTQRRALQNGWWRAKIFFWLSFVVLGFFIPPGAWVVWGNYFAPIFSFTFIFIGLVLLIDCAYSWAELCIENVETADDDRSAKTWQGILISSTIGLYLIALVLTAIMCWFFASSGCSMNQAAITINVVLAIVTSVISVHPTIQDYNQRAGLAQSAMVTAYCTYLTMSAVASEPDDKNCNPLIRSKGTRTFSIILGAIFTFVAIAYTTTRAASSSSANDYSSPDNEDQTMRRRALEEAVQEGTLPASALEMQDYESESQDEDSYNYFLFHLVFFLATQYTAVLLTMNVEKDISDHFIPVGRTYFSTWLKIVSSWLCYALYAWSLAAPCLMPNRF